MARIMLTVKGTPKDHVAISDNLPEDEATRQLQATGDVMGKVSTLRLPWITASGSNILAAQKLDDR